MKAMKADQIVHNIRILRKTFVFSAILTALIISAGILVHPAFANEEDQPRSIHRIRLETTIQNQIAQHLGGNCRVEIKEIPVDASDISLLRNLKFISESGNGKANFTAGKEGKKIGFWVEYSAWKNAWVPRRRILPGSEFKSGDLEIREVNISSGINHQSWALFVDSNQYPENYEAKNTLIEGTPVLRTQLQRKPDIRRGESVRIQMKSGDLILTTDAVAQENAAIGENIRVLTPKNKKELRGKLISKNQVEVNL